MITKKIILIAITIVLFCNCEPENKIVLSDLYTYSFIEVANYDTIIQNAQFINDGVYIEELDNYLLVGSDNSRDIISFLIDENGSVTGLNTYGGNQPDFPENILKNELDDNIYIVGSSRNNTAGQNDFMVIKTNLDGEEIWNKKYGTSNCDPLNGGFFNSLDELILFGGTMQLDATICSALDNYLVKVNSYTGDTIETVRKQQSEIEVTSSQIITINEVEDGIYFLLQIQNEVGETNSKIVLTTTSDFINYEDVQVVDVSPPISSGTVIKRANNKIILFTTSLNEDNRGTDLQIIELDITGQILNRIKVESECSESFKDFIALNDESIIVAGNLGIEQNKNDILLCKINFDDGVQWCNQYDLGQNDFVSKILNFNDEDLRIIGHITSTGSLDSEVISFKVSQIDGTLVD